MASLLGCGPAFGWDLLGTLFADLFPAFLMTVLGGVSAAAVGLFVLKERLGEAVDCVDLSVSLIGAQKKLGE